ncbi:MAG TPA: polysaccharide biosynthesis tyrosine autokinase [Trinickia sp.]|nr:polysaccharide biosynthesis tyrosine autokinase [Trinickia sp.]
MSSVAGDSPPEARDELDLIGVLDVLLTHRWSIIAITLACALIGAAYAFLSQPKYRADMLVQVEDSANTSAAKSVIGDVSALFDVKSSAAAEAQIIASRLVVTRAVDRLKSYIDARPERFPLIGEFVSRWNRGLTRPGILGIGGYAWGQESVSIERFDVPQALEGARFVLTMKPNGAWQLAGSDLDAPVHGQVGMEATIPSSHGPLVLNVTGFNALPGTRFNIVRNSRIETILNVRKRLDVQERVKQSGVIVAALTGDDAQRTSRLLHEIGDQYVHQNIDRKSADAAQSLAFLDGQLPVLKQQLARAEARYTAMRNASGSVDLPQEAQLALQQIAQAQTQQLLLQQKRDELATRYGAQHPSLIAIDRQIAALRQQKTGFDDQVKRLPTLQQNAARLLLDVQVDTELYTALLNNSQQLQLVKAGKVGSVRVVDMPIVPEDPLEPNRPLVIGGAALAGLVLGIAFAFARDRLFGGITVPDEIERALGLNVYATVPASASQRSIYRSIEQKVSGSHLLVLQSPDDPTTESLRSLRTALRFSCLRGSDNVLLVTGAEPSAGKSFLVANLAAVLSGEHRVLVVDADMRRGYLHQYFNVGRAPGLSEILEGRLTCDEAICHAVVTNVDFIATGSLPLNAGELLLGERLASLLDALKSRYDYVLIDAPPLLAAADATVIGRHGALVLMVARAGQTRIGDLRESLKRLAYGGVKPLGVVLNGLSPRLGRYGGKYGTYRYVHYEYRSDERRRGLVRRATRLLARRGRR